MPRYDKAIWRGTIPNMTVRGMNRYMGIDAHIQQGTLAGTDSWFHNPASQASAHWGIGKDGTVYQWVDTSDKAWAQAAGNPSWLSIEFEGHSGESLTQAQIISAAHVYAWAVQAHGIPVQLSDRPAIGGLGWHGMGGAAWGGHPDCPGQPIRNQLTSILALVHTILTPGERVRPMFTPAIALEPIVAELACPTGGTWLLAASGAVYAFGGAPFHGACNHQAYFTGRKAARLELEADGHYTVVATSGERYTPRDS